MLTEICQYLHNWFDRDQPKYFGDFIISNGVITSRNDGTLPFVEGMYFRIIGSRVNDGVHQYPSSSLKDESFEGAVWFMAVPPAFVKLAEDIVAWNDKYEQATLSPYQSESFGGYSYTKGSADGAGTWQSTFATRLNAWRKI